MFEEIFKHSNKYPRITDDEIDKLIAEFEINDDRDNLLNLSEAFSYQFWAHWTYNTVQIDDQHENLYRSTMSGHFGAYPMAGKNSAIMNNGYFLLNQTSLPIINSDIEGLREITPDEHRNNENRVLAAWHLTLARLHNKRMDVHGDYTKAFDEVVASFNKAILKVSLKMLEMNEREFLNLSHRSGKVHLCKEWAFQAARFGHPMMPEKFGNKELFDKTLRAADIDMNSLLSEDAGKVGLRMAPKMIEGSMGGTGDSILFKTVKTRHNEQDIACWGDVASSYKIKTDIDPCVPVFYGMLKESKDGRFGELGREIIKDGIAGTLLWPARGSQLGIYYKEPDDLPCTIEDIIKEVW